MQNFPQDNDVTLTLEKYNAHFSLNYEKKQKQNTAARSQKTHLPLHTTTDLDCSFCMHGDDIIGVPGELIQSHGCPLVDCFVFGLEVAH